MAVNIGSPRIKTVADPISAYESMVDIWKKSRAICNGERYVKDFDEVIDVNTFKNLLLPFSPSMTQQQYNFYKGEAELPGLVGQFAKTLIGGLLRKQPQLTLPDGAPKDADKWILSAFTQDNSPLSAFLDKALWEELQTSRCWVYVDYPVVANAQELTTQDFQKFKPYPIIWNAESVINWTLSTSQEDGTQVLSRVIVRQFIEKIIDNEWHPELVDTVFVHELVDGYYQIRKFELQNVNPEIKVINSQVQQNYQTEPTRGFQLVETIQNIMINGERLRIIPAWPLNGSINIMEPMLTHLVDREVALYNKISRRNHLLYGASTYTPIISSDMPDDKFQEVVDSGLGTWIHLNQGDQATVLETPTAALQDMDRAISATVEEMAKMGIRMLSPENIQSGVALELRNAAQTAQLGTLNTKVSNTLADIIAFMLNWRYGTEYLASDIEFQLSADFDPTPLGSDWLRLATEWYEKGLIPRTVWINILKTNDLIPPEYDDEEGQLEINQDGMIMGDSMAFSDKMKQMQDQLKVNPAMVKANTMMNKDMMNKN